jgi:hypothetical protein
MRRKIMIKESLNRISLFLVVIALLVFYPISVLAVGEQIWTCIGSTGTVDEADTSIVKFSGATATVKGSAPLPAKLDIRYNIVAEELLGGGDNVLMTVRYRDNGDAARVIVRIKELDLSTGAISTKLTFDSNDFVQASATQEQTVNTPCFSGSFFDFFNNAYWIEVQIKKTGADGTPALQGIQISYGLC